MPTATLDVATVLAAAGWTGATVGNLTASDDARATGGTAGEFVEVELTDVPAEWGQVNGDIVLRAEARTQGSVSRAKSLLMELRDAVGTVLASGSSGTIAGADGEVSVTLSGRTDDQAAANGWRLRYTVQEGGGMADSATVELDRIWLTASYAVGGVTADLAGAIPLALTAAAELPIEADLSGQLSLALTAAAELSIAADLAGAIPFALSAAATVDGGTPDPIDADLAGSVPLALTAAAELRLEAELTASLPLALVATATIPIAGDLSGVVPLELSATGTVDDGGPPPDPPGQAKRRSRIGTMRALFRGG